ncbi:MAG: phytanoyl-CoA dioxygenase family protein [Pelagibacteraceae bacterium]|nr:phytanoyl-CoA dioxygenase family protein [Pelagibacteraceae bacterium]MBT4951834.1 phytanoyl-CoA dioxygenase family protein [Pelagibacteraceae bacterium]MBT5214234.1 phytanoyl-CoA dioxygenase family protein [Pelagibacteraceae bacterium]MBT6197447.1 phytanoyl-CoA dioxygenase family protein [Pelagibacteraceae bacterium]
MLNFWNENGYLIIENFKTEEECDSLIQRSKELIEEQDFFNQKSVFDTVSQSHNDDSYFLESGDKIRFFFEEKAVLNDENIKSNKQYIVNKIGHALHDLDDNFIQFSKNDDLDKIAKAIGFEYPQLLQSMYIFKQPKIGGEVVCHQDSTFLITEPESTVGFWFALEDANKENGCLQVASGGHKGPLRKLFKRDNNKMEMIELSNEPFPETDTFVEVKKGSLVLLHGRLPHYSCENKSSKSRHAYTLHVIEGKSKYLDYNWLQRKNLKTGGFVDV